MLVNADIEGYNKESAIGEEELGKEKCDNDKQNFCISIQFDNKTQQSGLTRLLTPTQFNNPISNQKEKPLLGCHLCERFSSECQTQPAE